MVFALCAFNQSRQRPTDDGDILMPLPHDEQRRLRKRAA